MMKLSLMRDVFNTVNSDWDCELARELITSWKHDTNWVKMKRASANFIGKTKDSENNYIIRFNHNSERQFESIESELEILKYLKTKDLKIPDLIPSNNNSYIEASETGYGKFYTSVFELIPGKHYDIEDLTDQDFIKWGYTLGELHKAFKELPKSIKRKTHEAYFEELVNDRSPINTKENEEVKYLREWVSSLQKNPDNYGLIHYDFELDNTIWNDEGLYLIDFDDSIFSWFVADIAYALRDLFNDGCNFNKSDKRFLNFIKGYRELNDLSEQDLELIPNFYRLHHYISYKKLQKSVNLTISDENPDWMNNLIKKLTTVMETFYRGFSGNN